MPPKSKKEIERLKAEKEAQEKEARREKRKRQKELEASLINEFTVTHYPYECRDTIEQELSYTGINEYEYLNLNGSRKRAIPMGLEEVIRYLNTITDDKVVKHFDLGNNIGLDDVNVPSKMREFWKSLKETLQFNKSIIAIHLEGNHLFNNSEHPSNEHLTNYVMDFVNAIAGSKILHLDISENSITGEQGRMLKGLNQLMKRWATTALSFKCRMSRLHSQGFCTVSVGLGIQSSIMYLDLSDNFGGLDPNGRKNSEGIQIFCRQLAGTLNLRILKLARNFLGDEDIVLISQAVSYLKNLQILDLAGNICHVIGAEAIAEALLCHVNLTGLEGLKEIDLSGNPLKKLGLLALCRAIDRSDTLIILKIAHCEIERDEMIIFRESLTKNVLIEYLDVSNNPASDVQEDMAQAEIEANRLIITLRKNPFAVDTNKISLAAYSALARKLRFLTKDILVKLHKNATFNEVNSEMCKSLYLLEPPTRIFLLDNVKAKKNSFIERLKQSAAVNLKLQKSRIIYRCVMVWWAEIKKANELKNALAEIARKQAELDARNAEDDIVW